MTELTVYSDIEFEKLIEENQYVVVDFFAPYQSLCENSRIALTSLVDEMQNVTFGRLDISTESRSPLKYAVTHLPSILIFKDGKHMETVEGSWPKPQVKYRIDQYIESNLKD